MKTIIAVSLLILGLLGCASAGPIVSNISSGSDGNLYIEKCKVHSNFFLGTMELEECTNHDIKIAK